MVQQQIQKREISSRVYCDFCKESLAQLTIDTPKQKDVPLCALCFERVNVLAGVMRGKGAMHITKIFDKVKDATHENWRNYL